MAFSPSAAVAMPIRRPGAAQVDHADLMPRAWSRDCADRRREWEGFVIGTVVGLDVAAGRAFHLNEEQHRRRKPLQGCTLTKTGAEG